MREPNSGSAVGELLPDATRRLIRTTDALADDEYDAPSGLPDWSRAHVLAHLVLNAEGIAAALSGILEGERVPMYASQEARDGDIAKLATATPSVIRSRLLGASTELFDAIDALPADHRDTTVERVPGGRKVRAGDLPGMRLREVEIHHADLSVGYDRHDWPPSFATHLLDSMPSRNVSPDGFVARAVDLDRTWTFGAGGPTVTGAAADLGWWLTGRGTGADLTSDSGVLPQIGAW